MRIDGTSKPTGAYRAGPARSGATSAFSPEVESAPSAPAEVVPMAPASSLDALLALQAVDDPLQKRKKAFRRGQALLDTLDEVKADLLVGRVGEGKLNQLLSLIGQAREQTQPGLEPCSTTSNSGRASNWPSSSVSRSREFRLSRRTVGIKHARFPRLPVTGGLFI